jgi:hypothetical protein
MGNPPGGGEASSSGEWRRKRVAFEFNGARMIMPNRAWGQETALAWCVMCKHNGWIDGTDAAPNHPLEQSGGSQPDENKALLHAGVSATLRVLRERDPQSLTVIELQFGPVGTDVRRRTALWPLRGIMTTTNELALWPLVDVGAKLAAQPWLNRRRGPQRALLELVESGVIKDPRVAAMVSRAQRGALMLLQRARLALWEADELADGAVGDLARKLAGRAASGLGDGLESGVW